MKQIELDSTGTLISAIGFGSMHLSISGRPDELTAHKVLNASLDAGVSFIDTADVYCIDDNDIGHSERLIAAVLATRDDRDRIRVATKGGLRRPNGAWKSDGSPDHLRGACAASRAALNTEQIFLYQLHAVDRDVPLEKSVEALAELKREGRILHVGLSNVAVEQVEAARRIVDVVSVQNRLNPFFRESVDNGVVRYCADSGITFLAYSPVGGGRLVKKIPRYVVLQRIAQVHDVSPYAVVLAWVRAQGRTVVPIPSATKVQTARDSARTADLALSADEIAEIDATEFSTA
jgi:aryl-alcohol dehydrogenase-like predicted oxidoreductase